MTRSGHDRELFVWYRIDEGRADAARAAVDAMQRTLAADWPGLRGRLLIRDDGPVQTWMETYARAPQAGRSSGIDDEVQAAIAAAATRSLAGMLQGERHVEVFEVLPSA